MSNRSKITTQLKTDFANVTVANGYNNDFSNIHHWMVYPGEAEQSFWLNIQDGNNRREDDEGYKEILELTITASFVIRGTTIEAEEAALNAKCDTVIEDIITCLFNTRATYKTLLGEQAFMFQITNDDKNIELDENGGAVCEVIVNFEAHHKFNHIPEL